jgi:four helix bundle protein
MLDFERLDVYKCAIEHLALVLDWIPKLKRGAAVADPWRRAAMSIPMNIGEAAGKLDATERAHCFLSARGEAMECAAILDVVRLLRVIPDRELDRGRALVVRIVEMLGELAR